MTSHYRVGGRRNVRFAFRLRLCRASRGGQDGRYGKAKTESRTTEPASDGALITRFLLNRWVCGLCDHCRLVMPPATSHSDCSRNDNRASNEKPHVCPPNFTALNLTLPRSGLFRRIERWLTNSASAAVGI